MNDLVNSFGLNQFANSNFGDLSDGQKRRILIARALVHDPDVLVLDEPAINLDIGSKHILLEMLSKLSHQERLLCI